MTAVASQLPTAVAPGARGSAIRAQGLWKQIDGRTILEDVSFEIAAGEFVGILGANGAGKTTLLRMLATLAVPSGGQLLLFGQSARGSAHAIRRRIGLVAHQSMLYRDLSAAENLVFFARLYGVADPAARAGRLLDVMGLGSRADDPVKAFSRGMLQRLAIARALLHNPDILLADEPFEGLDAASVEATEALLASLREAGKTIVMVNHDIPQSLRLARRVLILRGGRLVVDAAAGSLEAGGVLSEVRKP